MLVSVGAVIERIQLGIKSRDIFGKETSVELT